MKLPLLITRDLITYPKFPLQFKIGRATSIKTATAAYNDHAGLILITAQLDPSKDSIDTKNLYKTAILAKITNFDPTGATPIAISVLGQERVIIESFEEKDIVYANYKGLVEKNSDSPAAKATQKDLLDLISNQLAGFAGMGMDQMIAPFANAKPGEFTDSFPFYLPIDLKDKYAILGEADVEKRINLLAKSINRMSGMAPMSTDVIEGDEMGDEHNVVNEINGKVNTKLQNQQREYMLREQLAQIEEELGEITGEENDISGLLKRVEENPYPQSVKEKLRKEYH